MRLTHPFASLLAALALASSLTEAASAETNVLRLATLWPRGTKWANDLQAAGREIARRTAGRVQLKLIEQHDLGEGESRCDGAMLAGTQLARYSRDSLVYSLPLLFRSHDEAACVRHTVDPLLAEALRGRGLDVLGMEDAGFAYIHGRAPIRTIDDLRHARVWVPAGEPEMLTMARAYGVSPVPLEPGDVRNALATGTVDTVIASPVNAIFLQWHTQVRSVMEPPFLYLFVVVAFRQDSLDRLAPADRAVLCEALRKSFADAFAEIRAKEPEALDVLAQNGVERLPLGATAEQRAPWIAWADGVADRLVREERISSNLLATVRRSLADCRGAATRHD